LMVERYLSKEFFLINLKFVNITSTWCVQSQNEPIMVSRTVLKIF
jgi:hypothetical protein